jgi:ABC-type polar amino acid transport system ATPase subunit
MSPDVMLFDKLMTALAPATVKEVLVTIKELATATRVKAALERFYAIMRAFFGS